MAKAKKSIFAGIAGADARRDSNYIRPSHGIWKINACRMGANRKKEDFFVVEMTLLHDLAPDMKGTVAGEISGGLYGHDVGEDASFMAMARHYSFLGNVKAFIVNVLDMDEDEVDEESILAVVNEDEDEGPVNPLANMIVEVSARNTVTQQNKDFTAVNFKGEVLPSKLLEFWEQRESDEKKNPDIKHAFSAEAAAVKYFPNPTLGELIEAEDEDDD